MKQVTAKAPADGDTVGNARFRNWVARRCSPRSTMILIMFATTAAGSIASFILLHAGVTHFGIRYSLAVLAAYGTLVALISLWGRYEARRLEQGDAPSGARGTVANFVDAGGGDIWPGWGGGGGGTSASARVSGGGKFGGGSSGGAGASASYDNASTPAIASSAGPGRSSSGGSSSGGGGFSLDLDGDEIVVLLLVIAAVALAFLAAAYIVWIAPKFLGDVLASTVAGAGMSHQITRHEPGWLGLVIKRTIWPALAVFVMFTAAGFALQSYAPGARTLHEAWEYHLARHAAQ
jgi:hypothetical protein